MKIALFNTQLRRKPGNKPLRREAAKRVNFPGKLGAIFTQSTKAVLSGFRVN